MVSQLDGVLLHDAVEDADLHRCGRVIYETMVYRPRFTFRATPAAHSRIAVLRAADMMAVVSVAIDRSHLIARLVAALNHLLNRNRALLAIHVTDHENRDVTELRTDNLSLSHHKTQLRSPRHRAAGLSLVTLPPQMRADDREHLAVRLSPEHGRSK